MTSASCLTATQAVARRLPPTEALAEPSYRTAARRAFATADRKTPVGWNDACTSGINNGTRVTAVMSDQTAAHFYLVLFTVSAQRRMQLSAT